MKEKNVLVLEYVDTYARAHQVLLQDEKITSYTLGKSDRLKKQGWVKIIVAFVKVNNIGLIVADTAFHVEVMDFLVDVKNEIKKVKIIYLTHQKEKYDTGNLPEPHLFIEEINDNPKIFVNLVKKILSEL